MPDAPSDRRFVRFGSFEFDPQSLELRRRGRTLPLAPQPARLLRTLLAAGGQLLTREELRQELWSRETFVDFESGLDYCLGRLRAALGDHARRPRLIETLPRRGYRFIGQIEHVGVPTRTLAVLPFDTIGGGAVADVAADAVSDGLMAELGTVRALRVISRHSVLGFRGSTLGIAEIARRLGADAVLEGSVLQHAHRLRITAQLIAVSPERHLWAGSHDGDTRELMDLLRRTTRGMAAGIQAALLPDEASAADGETCATEQPARAQRAFLEACFHVEKWTAPGLQRGLTLLHEAIAQDPAHAPAHATLACALSLLGYSGQAPWRIVYPQARVTAERALRLDPASAAAHSTLAFLELVYDWDFAAARERLACAADTGQASRLWLLTDAVFRLWIHGDREKARAAAEAALEIDPVSPFTNAAAAWLLLMSSRYSAAAAQAGRTLQLHPGAHHATTVLAWTHALAGRFDEALPLLEGAAAASADEMTLGALGHVYALAGRRDEAHGVLERLTREASAGHACVKSIAGVLAGLDEADAAFEWIDRGIAERDGGLLSIRVSPAFLPLLRDRRFDAATRRMGLPPPGQEAGTAAREDPRQHRPDRRARWP